MFITVRSISSARLALGGKGSLTLRDDLHTRIGALHDFSLHALDVIRDCTGYREECEHDSYADEGAPAKKVVEHPNGESDMQGRKKDLTGR